MKLRNFVKRFIALSIDFLVLYVMNFFILLIIVLITKMANIRPINGLHNHTIWAFIIQYLFPIAGFILTILYFVFMETKFNATLGKMALKIRTKTIGGRISTSQAFIRFILMNITSIVGIDFIFYLFSKKNQFLHDWLTKTYVE